MKPTSRPARNNINDGFGNLERDTDNLIELGQRKIMNDTIQTIIFAFICSIIAFLAWVI